MHLLTLSKDMTVLVQQEQQPRNLGTNGRHVVRVEVVLDGAVKREAFVHQENSTNQEDDVESHDSLLKELEDDNDGGGSWVDSSTDQDQTEQKTNNGINNSDGSVGKDTQLEQANFISDVVHGLFRLIPFNEDPPDGDGGVDHANNGNGLHDSSNQSRSAKTTSFLFHENDFLPV